MWKSYKHEVMSQSVPKQNLNEAFFLDTGRFMLIKAISIIQNVSQLTSGSSLVLNSHPQPIYLHSERGQEGHEATAWSGDQVGVE